MQNIAAVQIGSTADLLTVQFRAVGRMQVGYHHYAVLAGYLQMPAGNSHIVNNNITFAKAADDNLPFKSDAACGTLNISAGRFVNAALLKIDGNTAPAHIDAHSALGIFGSYRFGYGNAGSAG